MSNPTIKEQLRLYELWLDRQDLSPHSKRSYSSHARAFVEFASDSADAFCQVHNYAQHLLGEAAKPATINTKLTAIAHFARFCGNTSVHIERARVTAETLSTHVLTTQDEFLLLSTVAQSTNTRDRAIFLLLFHTGIRPRECCAANLASINLTAGTATFTANKSGKVRVVTLHRDLQEALTVWLAERKQPDGRHAEALFVTSGGQRISTSVVDNVVRKFGLQTRIVISARTIRNTFLRKLAINGTSAQALARLGGHRRPGLVKRYFEASPTNILGSSALPSAIARP